MESPTAGAKHAADQGCKRILATLKATADDKLAYRPSPTSRTILEIVAHVGFANQAIARSMQGESTQTFASLEELAEATKPMLATITSRQQGVDLLTDSISNVNAALDALKPENLGKEVTVPFGKVPMHFLIFAPGMHMAGHSAQIDYIQTMYGDLANHMD